MAFLGAGKPIVERLRAAFTAASQQVDVYTAIDGGAALESALTKPAVYVVFDGYRPTQELALGAIQQIEQIWAAIVKVPHVNTVNTQDGTPADATAGPVIDTVLGALCGWRPAIGFQPLRMGEGEGPKLMSGHAYYPLFFWTRIEVRGTP